MNCIFFSPHFPANSTDFCERLHQQGATVLGIGDLPYDQLNDRLKHALTDYISIHSMENDDEVLRAVGLFTHRFGKIDRFESLNEHWLELEASIRTDFNIYGTKLDFVESLKHKSKMKEYFEKSGHVHVIAHEKDVDEAKIRTLIERVGYPLVVKPDAGAGANMTYKLRNEEELARFLERKPENVSFIAEEFINGDIITFDGLIDRDGIVRFAASHLFDQSVMEVVNSNDHLHYYCLKDVEPDIEKAGTSILEAFGIRERFFHIELFRSRTNGKLYALEVNMRPPGAWMTDAINYSRDCDVYNEWARMVVHNHVEGPFEGKYYVAYASRKDHKRYTHSHDQLLQKLGSSLLHYSRIEDVFSAAMGNEAYQVRAETLQQVRDMVHAIQHEAEELD